MLGTAARRAIAKDSGSEALKKGAKRDPELYVKKPAPASSSATATAMAIKTLILAAIMSGVFGAAGYYFGMTLPSPPLLNRTGRKPTSATSETKVAVADLPWEKEGATGKYSYHPQANLNNAPKEAPSALHSVVIPNVNLPKELHEKYNKWGKEGY
ncbi:hypothetical protein B7463_g11959, partial [Scytalidium lignicola]